MPYCEKFESVIRQIIFKEETVPQVLYKALYDFYIKEDEDARTQEAYTQEARTITEGIKEKIEKINKEKGVTIDLEQDISSLIPQFIKDFAKYFHSITFLNEALEDAPPIIKEQKLPLYMEVLSQLDSKEAQEKELTSLSFSTIKQMIVGAKEAYEQEEDAKLALRYQQLAHMCVWEMVARRLPDLIKKETPASKVEFLQSLQADLPEVGSSDIFDTLSQYRDSTYQTFKEFIQTNLQDGDLAFQEAEREFFHTLRFGQKELREYLNVRQSKLAMSLFWARDIRDDSLAKGTLAANLFREMAEKQVLKISGKVGDLPPLPGFSYMAEILQAAKTLYKKRLEDTKNPKDATAAVERFLTDKIINPTPYYTLSKEQIKVAFPVIQFIDESGTKGHQLLTEITSKMGRNWSSREFNARILNTTLRGQAVDSVIFTGNSLDEIEQQIKQISEEAKRDSFLAGLEGIRRNLEKPVMPVVAAKAERKSVVPSRRSAASAVKAEAASSFEKPFVFEISQLGLSDSNERLLRQLLELHFVYKKLPEEAKSYSSLERFRLLFKKIEAGVFTDFKIEEIEPLSAEEKQQGINALVETQYQNLASFTGIEDSRAQQILSNARALQESRTERQEQTSALHAILESSNESELAAGIEHIFIEEYQKMLPVLKVSNDLLRRDLKDMAKDTAKLLVRMKKGEPIISKEESAVYYRVVENLLEHLKRENLSLENVSFKVKHSNGNSQEVVIYDLNGKELTTASIRASLPYSLIKAPGQRDFIFSLGGKRGVEAPFEGLENPNTRYFTATRLAGVGQYGTVKAVVSLKTSDMRVIKKGVLEEGAKTKESARKSPFLRGMTSRADPRLPKIESLILQEISSQNQYWESEGKERQAGLLYEDVGRSREFRILMDRVAGQSYADFAVARFTPYDKAILDYHNPVVTENFNDALEETLDLAKAIVEEASRLEKRGFIHNDIKPENFHFLKTQAGYEVHYLDWATGGFEATYEGDKKDLEAIFQQKFNADFKKIDGQLIGQDEPGFFVKKDEEGRIRYGINPSLEINHGARHGTLPYISPELARGPSSENVELSANDSRMDDWALTALIFGVCNKEAYFNIVKGRVVLDYVIPGILEVDSQNTNALKIENQEKFDNYFKVDEDVMFIPSNKREGEPLHLYRRLLHLQKQVKAPLAAQIDELLKEVREAVAAGKGLSKEALEKSVAKATRYFYEYEKSLDQSQQAQQQSDHLTQEIIDEFASEELIEPNSLLTTVNDKTKFNYLIKSSLPGVEDLWDRINFSYDKFFKMAIESADAATKGASLDGSFVLPGSYLLIDCIQEKNESLLIKFLDKISPVETSFFDFVEQQGLIHLALEQGLTSAATKLMETLSSCKEKEAIFDLLIKRYTAEDKTFLNWSMNTLHIAIANQSLEQLEGILEYLPEGEKYKSTILHALHFSASLGYAPFFDKIFDKYNRINSSSLTVSDVLNAQIDSEPSAYHQFLKYEQIDNPLLKEDPASELIKRFLLDRSGGEYALVIAASHENYQALQKLYDLVAKNNFSEEEIKGFFNQQDKKEHNLLFHLLEQKQSGQLAAFLSTLETLPKQLKEDILSTLVSSQADLFDVFNRDPQIKDLELLSHVLDALKFDEAFYAEQLLNLQDWFVGVPDNNNAIKKFLERSPLSFNLKEHVFMQFSENEQGLKKDIFSKLAADCQSQRELPQAVTVNVGEKASNSVVLFDNLAPPPPFSNVIHPSLPSASFLHDAEGVLFTPREARSIPAPPLDEGSDAGFEQDSLQGEFSQNSSSYSQRSLIEEANEDLEKDLDYIAFLKEEIAKLQRQVGNLTREKAESAENAKMFEEDTNFGLQIQQLNNELANVKASAQENISKIQLEKVRLKADLVAVEERVLKTESARYEANSKVQSADSLRAQAELEKKTAEDSLSAVVLERDGALAKVSNLEKDLLVLKDKFDTGVNENEQEISHLKNEIARLQAELMTAQENLTQTESILENKTLALQTAEDNAQKAERESAVSRVSVGAAMSAQKQAEESKAALERENEQLKTLIEQSQEKSTLIESEIERLQRELNQTSQIVKDLESLQSNAETRASRAEKENTEANAKVEAAVAAQLSAEKNAAAIQEEKDALLTELKVVKKEVSRLETASDDASLKAEAAETLRAKAEVARESALESLKIAESERNEASDAITLLQKDLEAANVNTSAHQEEIRYLKEQIEKLQEEQRKADEARQKAEQELVITERKLQAAEAFSATRDASSKDAISARDEAQTRLIALQKEMAELNHALIQANTQVAEAQQEKSHAQVEIGRLGEALEQKAKDARLNEEVTRENIKSIQSQAAADVIAAHALATKAHNHSASLNMEVRELRAQTQDITQELLKEKDKARVERDLLQSDLQKAKEDLEKALKVKEDALASKRSLQEESTKQISSLTTSNSSLREELKKATEEAAAAIDRVEKSHDTISGIYQARISALGKEIEIAKENQERAEQQAKLAHAEKERALANAALIQKEAIKSVVAGSQSQLNVQDNLGEMIKAAEARAVSFEARAHKAEARALEAEAALRTASSELGKEIEVAKENQERAEQQAKLAHAEKERALANAALIQKEAIKSVVAGSQSQLNVQDNLGVVIKAAEARAVSFEARAHKAEARASEAEAALRTANEKLAEFKQKSLEESSAAESKISALQAQLDERLKELQRASEENLKEKTLAEENYLSISNSLEEVRQKLLDADAAYQSLQQEQSFSKEELIRKQREFSTDILTAKEEVLLTEKELSLAKEETLLVGLRLESTQKVMQEAQNEIKRLEETLRISQNQGRGLEADKDSLETGIEKLSAELQEAQEVIALIQLKEEQTSKEVRTLESQLLHKEESLQKTKRELENLEAQSKAQTKAVSSRSTDLRKSLAQARNTHRNVDSNEPSLVRVSGHITRPQSSLSLIEDKSGFIVYADLKKDGDISTLSRQSSFNEEGVIQISPNEGVDLTNEEHQQLFSEGLEVTSSSGYDFHLQANSQEYLAELKASAVSEMEDYHDLQNIAVAVKEMIDNIVSKCSEVEIISDNAFIHTFANAYIKYLKTEEGLAIKSINAKVYETDEDTLKAQDVFEKLKPQFSKSSDCYQEAKSRTPRWGRNSIFSSQSSEASHPESSPSLSRKP